MVIKALQHVPHCYTYDDGLVIAKLLQQQISAGHTTILSFEGVTSVPSSFVNGAFVSLLDTIPVEELKLRLRFQNSTRQINSLVKARVEAAASANTAAHSG